jgi:hypothetical protein
MLTSLLSECRSGPRESMLSRVFGIAFILFCAPAIGLVIEIVISAPSTVAWFEDHHLLRIYEGLSRERSNLPAAFSSNRPASSMYP